MNTRVSALIILALLVSGCGTMEQFRKMEQLSEMTQAYEQAIRWSEFDYATVFLEPSERDANPSDESFYKRIKVTDYKTKKTAFSDDETQAIQIVEISYYKIDNMIVKSFSDHQLWEWHTKDKRWYLKSGLPEFK
ncbi:MAG: hypothetical protein PVF56_12215 [Desulfobacterales bacterium]|jgi:hypothetical protein